VSGSVRFLPEQISAVTDSVLEQRQPDHTITNKLPSYNVFYQQQPWRYNICWRSSLSFAQHIRRPFPLQQ